MSSFVNICCAQGDVQKLPPLEANPEGSMKEPEHLPNPARRGWLKNGNPPGDFLKARRCGARTRSDTNCRCPAMANGRCRLHGGLSTGPKNAVHNKPTRQVPGWWSD